MKRLVVLYFGAVALYIMAPGLAGFAAPAAPNRTTVEAVVVKLAGADKKGHLQLVLRVEKATGGRPYKKGAELVVVPRAELKVNDTISGTVRLVGDEWHNHTSLFNVKVLKRRAPLTIRKVNLGRPFVKRARLAARDGNEWLEQARPLMMPGGKEPAVPKVDWRKEMVLLAAMGEQRSTGYGTTITRVEERLREIVVSVREKSPAPGEITGDAMTYPSHQVAVPRSNLPVRFVAEGREDEPFAVPYQVVAKGYSSAWKKARRRVIRDTPQWKKLWKGRLRKGEKARIRVPKVDFTKKMVIALLMGEQRTGGYSVRIERVMRTPDAVEVYVKQSSPPPSGGAAQVLTQPYFFAAIDRTDFPVTFVEVITPRAWNYGTTVNAREKKSRVIRTQEDWKKALKGLGANKAGFLKPNFKTEMILAVFVLPTKKNLGVRITGIFRKGGKLLVEYTATPVHFKDPKPHTGFGFAVVPKLDLEVTFVQKHAPASVKAKPKPLPFAVGRIIVLFKKGVGHDKQLEVIKKLGCRPSRRFKTINGYLVLIPRNKIPADRDKIAKATREYLKKFQSHPSVKSAELDQIMGIH